MHCKIFVLFAEQVLICLKMMHSEGHSTLKNPIAHSSLGIFGTFTEVN